MDLTPYLATSILALLGKIVFDWLSPKKTNGSSGERAVEYWNNRFDHIDRVLRELQDRQMRMWEYMQQQRKPK